MKDEEFYEECCLAKITMFLLAFIFDYRIILKTNMEFPKTLLPILITEN